VPVYSLEKNKKVFDLAEKSDYYSKGVWQEYDDDNSPLAQEGDSWNPVDGFVPAVQIAVA
jgi:hypothetical protein